MAEGNVPQRGLDKAGRRTPTEISGQLIKNVMRILEDRNRKAIALAMTLASQLEPEDGSNPDDSTDPVAWSLAELLEAHLVNIGDLKTIRGLLEAHCTLLPN